MTPRLDPEEVGLHTIRPKPGSRHPRRRRGRGGGSGLGKTSGRGHKGAGARSGNKRKPGYEGGQNPIHMRTRKLRGPHKKMSMPFEPFRTHTQPVNVADLEERFAAGDQVTPETLRAAGLAKRRHPIKVLARGELTKKLTVRAHGFSATAKDKIEQAGGTVEVIPVRTSDEVAGQVGDPAATPAPEPDGNGAEGEASGGVAPEEAAE